MYLMYLIIAVTIVAIITDYRPYVFIVIKMYHLLYNIQHIITKGKFSKEEGTVNGSPPCQNITPTDVQSKQQSSSEEESWPLSSPKDAIFPETIPEESSSTEEEHVVCLINMPLPVHALSLANFK